MAKVGHVTNGIELVSMHVDMQSDDKVAMPYYPVVLTAEQAIDLATQLLIHARNVQERKHGNSGEARIITTKDVLYQVERGRFNGYAVESGAQPPYES